LKIKTVICLKCAGKQSIDIFMQKPTKLSCSSLHRIQNEIMVQKEFQRVKFEVCQ
jgi:hypothetical protein